MFISCFENIKIADTEDFIEPESPSNLFDIDSKIYLDSEPKMYLETIDEVDIMIDQMTEPDQDTISYTAISQPYDLVDSEDSVFDPDDNYFKAEEIQIIKMGEECKLEIVPCDEEGEEEELKEKREKKSISVSEEVR